VARPDRGAPRGCGASTLTRSGVSSARLRAMRCPAACAPPHRVRTPSHPPSPVRVRFTPARKTRFFYLRANPLTKDMLVKVDRASGAHHLEAGRPVPRSPSGRIRQTGLPERFSRGTNGKRVLRHLHRKSFGRPPSEEAWVSACQSSAGCGGRSTARASDSSIASDSSGSGSSPPDELSNGGHRRWATTEPMVLWHAFALAAWCEVNLGDGPDATRKLIEHSTRKPSADGVTMPLQVLRE
jgi:hypothetical protein